MATRKKNQAPTEQTEQEQKDIQQEQTGQEKEADRVEQTEQEQDTGAVEQTEQDGDKDQGNGKEDKPGKEPERDVFADIPNPCVYCGPSVRGVARQYTTYQGGIPAELKEFIKAHPAARRLIVSTAKFASVRKRLETPGTAEAAIYKKVRAEL